MATIDAPASNAANAIVVIQRSQSKPNYNSTSNAVALAVHQTTRWTRLARIQSTVGRT